MSCFGSSLDVFGASAVQVKECICFSFRKAEAIKVSVPAFFGPCGETGIDPLLSRGFVIEVHDTKRSL